MVSAQVFAALESWRDRMIINEGMFRWYWKGKPENAGQMENAISDHPIGLHKYKQDFEIRELEQHFYGPPDNKFIKKMDPRTKAYVQKVRKALGRINR